MLTNNLQMSLKNEYKKKRRAYLGMILSNKIDRNSVNQSSSSSLLSSPPYSVYNRFHQRELSSS